MPSYILKGNGNVKTVEITDSVKIIDSSAFYGCTSLNTVYYSGVASEWNGISIGSFNENLTSAPRYYYSETAPTVAGNYWHYVDGVPTKW